MYLFTLVRLRSQALVSIPVAGGSFCESLREPMRLKAKIRYRHPEQDAVAWQTEDGVLHVRFDKPQRAITRGQAVVLYDGDIVVGGGVIESCIK